MQQSLENAISRLQKIYQLKALELENIKPELDVRRIAMALANFKNADELSSYDIEKIKLFLNNSSSELDIESVILACVIVEMANSNIKTTNTSNFLNEAGFIIEKLNSISIDISSILSPEINQELWNKYNAGHKSVFSRYLSKTLDKKQINSLHELINTNSEFAQYVKSFIKEFNNIIAKASTTDKSEILVETLTSTDIGKIYMLLREIVQ